MNDHDNQFFAGAVDNGRHALDLIGRLLRVAEPGAVYAPPVTSGDRTVVLASELSAAIGVGYGGGLDESSEGGSGGGGGGGGYAAGRPVAAVVIDANGVHVEPVVDVTKLGIAAFTTLAAMFLTWSRMRRALAKGKSHG